MKFDFISDLHLDYNLKIRKLNDKKKYIDFIKKLSPKNETIILAGDLADTNEYIFNFLKVLKGYFYKNVIYVLGNHEYYVPIHDVVNSKAKIETIKEFCYRHEIYLLDGGIIEIDGIKFGGTMGWYDCKYLLSQYSTSKEDITNDWTHMSLDATYIRPQIDIFDFFEVEKKKIEKVYRDCDVMITHVNPSISDEHFSYKYKYHNYQYFKACIRIFVSLTHRMLS